MNFNDKINEFKSKLKGLIDSNSSNEFIEKISSLDKDIDEVVDAHESTAKELQETKESLVNYVKNTGFKNPSGDTTPEPKEDNRSLDEIMEDCLKEIK